jgi:hypothetical protein
MSVSIGHVFEQGQVLGGLARTAFAAIRQQRQQQKNGAAPVAIVTPGAWVEAVLPPRSPKLVADYVRHVGGDPSAWRDALPPHLFPQWSFGLAARTLEGVPYPLLKVMNGGCRVEVRAPLPAREPLRVRVRLASIDDNGQRAILDQEIVTGTDSAPDALVAHLFAYVPLARAKRDGATKARPRVPDSARELSFWRIPANAGLDFALLTGDFNPVHWVPPYARSMGFRGTILHGFSTLARAWEGLGRSLFAGSSRAVTGVDVRFTRPLLLPARVGLYLGREQRIHVGDAPGGGAYLDGTFTARPV